MLRPGFGLGPGLGNRRRVSTMIDFVGPMLPPGARLSRASPGYWSDPGGVLRSVAIDAPRFDYGDGGAARGLLIEVGATNMLPWSGGFAARWIGDAFDGGVNPAITAVAGVAPDGSATATRIAYNRGGGYSRVSFFAGQASAGSGERRVELLVARGHRRAKHCVADRRFGAGDC